MAVIRFDQVSAPVQQQATHAPQGAIGSTIAQVGASASHSLASLAASLFHMSAQSRATQQAMNDAGAMKDADDAYFSALEQVAVYRRDVADGTRDSRSFFKDVLDPNEGILSKAWNAGYKTHMSRPSDAQSGATFEKQLVSRFHPLREKLLTEWTQDAVKQTKDSIDSATTLFSTNGTTLSTPWGAPYEAVDLVHDYLGLQDRVKGGIRAGAMTQEAGTKHLQDTLVSTVLARQSRIYKDDPFNADARVAAEMQQITPLLDSNHQLQLNDARQKGELTEKGEVERQLQRNLQLGIMPIGQALSVAKDRGLDPAKLYDAQVGGMRSRNDIADLAFKENDRFAEGRSKSMADAYELRVLTEKGFSFSSEMQDSSKFYQMRDDERKRVFAFEKTVREASATMKSDPRTLDRVITMVYEDPDQARKAILGSVGKTLSLSDAEEYLKLAGSHKEKLKDKRVADTHSQYVAALHDLDESLKTVGGGSTENDPIALAVKGRYTQTLRELMFDPDNKNSVGSELQAHLDWLKKQAIDDLKRKSHAEGSNIVTKYRLYDEHGAPSYRAVYEARKDNLISELEAKRARDYIDIKAHDPSIPNKPAKPKTDKPLGRKFERAVE